MTYPSTIAGHLIICGTCCSDWSGPDTIGIGFVVLAAFAAVTVPPYGDLGSSPGSGDSAM